MAGRTQSLRRGIAGRAVAGLLTVAVSMVFWALPVCPAAWMGAMRIEGEIRTTPPGARALRRNPRQENIPAEESLPAPGGHSAKAAVGPFPEVFMQSGGRTAVLCRRRRCATGVL